MNEDVYAEHVKAGREARGVTAPEALTGDVPVVEKAPERTVTDAERVEAGRMARGVMANHAAGALGTAAGGTTAEGTAAGKPRMSYREMFEQLAPLKKPMTDEERLAEEKKERRQRRMASIGDAVSALSNLFFTAKGAPNMFTGQQTQSKKTADRWQKLKAEREANNRLYYEGLMRAQQADDAENYREWMKDQQGKREEAERKRNEEAHARWVYEQAARNAKAEREKEEHDKRMEMLGYQVKKAESDARYADAVNRRKLAGGSGSGGGSGGKKKYTWIDENGKEQYAGSEREAIDLADAAGTLKQVPVVTDSESWDEFDGKPINVKKEKTTRYKPRPMTKKEYEQRHREENFTGGTFGQMAHQMFGDKLKKNKEGEKAEEKLPKKKYSTSNGI